MNVSAYLKGSFQVQISVIVIVSDKLDKNWEKTDRKYVQKDMKVGGVKRDCSIWSRIVDGNVGGFSQKMFELIQTTLIFVWKKKSKKETMYCLSSFFFKESPCLLSYWEARNPHPLYGLELCKLNKPFWKKKYYVNYG